jgi:branched-chain amino acid transport system ATP-binding protein
VKAIMLDVSNINVFPGGSHVLWDISFRVEEGEVMALLGANGAGKTTLLETIIGMHKPRTGKVEFLGERIDGYKPYHVVQKGVALVPEGRQIFPQMSVLENLLMGAGSSYSKERFKESLELIFKDFPVLKERKNQLAGTLSGGEQQMLAIGRALASNPRLLMLDEPSSGLGPKLVDQVFVTLEKLTEEKRTIILVEQHVKRALDLAKRALVLENGRISLAGDSASLKNNESVRKAYLGM